ncbi:Choline transport protein [Fusarium oxysporum f. sp. albedinis]|nr:Choline transport protein [Fusarium oxysporum f. sp. albedinis]
MRFYSEFNGHHYKTKKSHLGSRKHKQNYFTLNRFNVLNVYSHRIPPVAFCELVKLSSFLGSSRFGCTN